MGTHKYTLPVAFEPDDAKILEAVVAATGGSRVGVLRWAIRYYSLKGPWARSKRARVEAIGGLEHGAVGPEYEEAI